MSRFVVALLLAVPAASPAVAAPAAAPRPAEPIAVHVDARDVARKILHARLTFPVAPGPCALAYPKWIPGEHGPTGPIVNLVDVTIGAAGQAVPWHRDPVDMFTLRCDAPAGARSLDVSLDFLIPTGGDFTAGRSASDVLATLSWNSVLLYPLGPATDTLTYQASLTLPDGWSYASALPETGRKGQDVTFAPVSLTRLVDSPVLMGAHMKTIRLGEGTPSHAIEVAADSAGALEFKSEWKPAFDRLPEQAYALFGARHYGSYRWLLALSDHVEHFGLEHHESSDDRLEERSFEGDRGRREVAFLLSHEYVHSWNGKFRRPADLATPDYAQPMRSELLWVYEGLTEYLGALLPARSGTWTPDEYRENLASLAAEYEQEGGRRWRPLDDTAVAAQILYGAPAEGASRRRGVDFYDESLLIWLEADVAIRKATGGERSLDDFCRRFHGGPEGPYVVRPYTRAEVLATLNAIAPRDWAAFFAERVDRVAPQAPLGGIAAGGWKLVFTETPNVFRKDHDERTKEVDERASIGIALREDGRVKDVVPGLAADKAAVAPGVKLVAVNGRKYTPEVLRDALRSTRSGGPLELLVENEDYFHACRLAYDGGLRYPHLVRDESQPDVLSQILAARKP